MYFCSMPDLPRAPEMYFSQKIDYLKDKVQPTFVEERPAMKREYEVFKVRINALVAKATKVPPEGWIMQDGTPWPGHNGGLDAEGHELPRLVYVSREKRLVFQHHKKAGAMNALDFRSSLHLIYMLGFMMSQKQWTSSKPMVARKLEFIDRARNNVSL